MYLTCRRGFFLATAMALAAGLCAIFVPDAVAAASPRKYSVEVDVALGDTGKAAEAILREALDSPVDGRADITFERRILVRLDPKLTIPESYSITHDAGNDSPTLVCAGADRRGCLYAAYDLAERIRHRERLDDLNITERPHCIYRQIVICSCDHPFTLRLVKAMPRWRMNGLLLYSAFHQPDRFDGTGPGNFVSDWFNTYLTLPISYRNHPKIREMREDSSTFRRVREEFPKLLALSKTYGVDVSLKYSVLNYVRVDQAGGHYRDNREDHFREDFPEIFAAGRKEPDWNGDAVYGFIREQLEELFTTYPNLAGITAASEEMASFHLGHVNSPGAPEERRRWIRRLVETVQGVCDRFDKRCYWDLHGSGRLFIDTLLDLSRERPGGLRLRAESVPIEQVFSDRFPSYTFEKVARAGDGMADHDVHMEGTLDFPWLPGVLDRYVVRHTRAALDSGLKGGGAMWYIYRPHYSPLNDLSGINMELISRLLWNPAVREDAVWDQWLKRQFGAEAAAPAGKILRSTQSVLNDILYFNQLNAPFWFQYGFPGDLDWLMRPTWGQLIEYFQPPGTPVYAHPFSAVCRERTVPMDQMRAEKARAVAGARGLLDSLEKNRAAFRQSDYEALLPRYVALLYFARAAEQLTESLWAFSNLHIDAYDPACTNPRHRMEEAMANLRAIHKEMEADDRFWLLEPSVLYRGLRHEFIRKIPSLLSDLEFHDRVLTTPAAVAKLPESERKKAETILSYAKQIREKFKRNRDGTVPAEELWAKTLGDK